MENIDTARYQRQILLKELGTEGQCKLSTAKVLVIGAGGLGCPILQYLAAAGIGTLGIVDHDVVELSNLHRQILYTMTDIGFPKAACAAARLQQFNPGITVIPYQLQLSNQNAVAIISEFDIVIDGSDNFPTRYMINDACALLNKPLIYGALSVSEGQVSVFSVPDSTGAKVNYRDVFPTAPKPGEVLNCAEAGVLGVLPGIIGTMQAAEAIKLITGIGTPLINRMLIYNLYTHHTYQINLKADQVSSSLPADLPAFLSMDYNWFCGIKPADEGLKEISRTEFNAILGDERYTIIDVREYGEVPEVTAFKHLSIPLSELREDVPLIDGDQIVLFCQSGIRSVIAGELLLDSYPDKRFYTLKGGIIQNNDSFIYLNNT